MRGWDGVQGTTDYVYSGLNVVDEIRGGAHEKHVYTGSMHLASISSGTVEYYHVDHLGSTRLKTNSTGGVIYESNYEPRDFLDNTQYSDVISRFYKKPNYYKVDNH